MKTLEQFIKEHLSKEEFIEQIKTMKDDDFRKLTELYLRKDNKSFKESFKEFCKEKNIPGIASFWSYFDVFSGRNEMITKMLEKSGDRYTNLITVEDLKNNNEKNIFDLIAKTIYPHSRNEKLKTKFISILKEISIDDKRTGKAATGRFEHLLTLFLDGVIEPANGDIIFRSGKTITQIEVKYCKNSDFGAYKTKTLTNQTLEDISKNQTLKNIAEDGGKLDSFLSSYLDKDFTRTDKDFAKALRKKLPSEVTTDIVATTEKRRGRPKKEKSDEIVWLEKYFLCLQFYLYLMYQFNKNYNNQYLLLFRSTGLSTNINSKIYGEYKIVDVNDIIHDVNDIEKTAEDIVDFVVEYFIPQNVNRNKVEFTLK